MTDSNRDRATGLARLLQIENDLRSAPSLERLDFHCVNQAHRLVPFRQGVLWWDDAEVPQALSSVPVVDRNTPYVQFLRRLYGHIKTQARAPFRPDPAQYPEAIREQWSRWLPDSVLCVPCQDPVSGHVCGLLLVARPEPFLDYEVRLLHRVAGTAAHARQYLRLSASSKWPRAWRPSPKKALVALAVLALIGILALPVRLSVVAPAEVVPDSPLVVRSPLSGVVDEFLVAPDQAVEPGTPLIRLDDTKLRNQKAVAEQSLRVLQAEYQQHSQRAFSDRESSAKLRGIEARIDQKREEIAYLDELLSRVTIRAEKAGIVIFESPDEWVGKPVELGERLLTITGVTETKLEVRLPVDDVIAFDASEPVHFFPTANPGQSVAATLHRMQHSAEPVSEGFLAYRLYAMFSDPSKAPRVGLGGVAKLFGERVPLAYFLLRRPIVKTRQWLGL